MSHELPILYTFRRCPYAIRARLAIKASNIAVETREVKLSNKPAEMLAVSPKGTVPVLVLPDGTVIEESLEIMLWALEQNDPDTWLEEDNGKSKELIALNDTGFKTALDHYKYADRFPELSMETYRDKAACYLDDFNKRLQNNTHLISDKLTMADMAIFPFVRQCAFVDKEWFNHTKFNELKAWLDSILTSPLFNDVMIKHAQWSSEK